MALSIASLRRTAVPKPPIVVLYGVSGWGKTTFAVGAPDPVLAAVEDGLGSLGVPNWPIGSYAEVMEAVGSLYSEDHDRRTFVVDSLDWLAPLVEQEAMRRNGWDTFDQPYGKGPTAALLVWREFLEGVRALRDEKGMAVVLVAHEKITKFEAPDSEGYSRYGLKIHDKAAALVTEQADIVGFMNFRVSVKETKSDFGARKTRGVGAGQRVLYLEERPAFVAKSRFATPPSIDIPTQGDAATDPGALWNHLSRHLPVLEH